MNQNEKDFFLDTLEFLFQQGKPCKNENGPQASSPDLEAKIERMIVDVLSFLLEQGVPSYQSVDGEGAKRCSYRGDNGLKCAVGCLIPDELYGHWMEGKISWSIFDQSPEVQEAIFQKYGFQHGDLKEVLSALDELQAFHDSFDPGEKIYIGDNRVKWYMQAHQSLVFKNFDVQGSPK